MNISKGQVIDNVKIFYSYQNSIIKEEREFFNERVRLGRVFLVINSNQGLLFSPSRFIGYPNNSIDKHNFNKDKDGRDTNLFITGCLGFKPTKNAVFEEKYYKYCKSIKLETTNHKKKFWVLDKIKILITEKIIEEIEYEQDLKAKIKESSQLTTEERQERLKTYNSKPETIKIVSKVFKRNPDVVAEILFNANGICGICKNPAPFKRSSDNTPYLEVHHIIHLARGGEDTVENSIAVCPNCHRKAHFG